MSNNNETLRTRIRLFAIGLIILFAVLAWRLYHVQIVRHDDLYSRARRQVTSVVVTTPKRGEILDRNGNLLVGNEPCEELIADPSIVGAADRCLRIAEILEKKLGLNRDMVYRKLMHKSREITLPDGRKETRQVQYTMLARNIKLEDAKAAKEALKSEKLTTGLVFTEAYMRSYIKSSLLSNILGITRMEQDRIIPASGVEKLFNKEMSGAVGKRRYERALGGTPLYYGNTEEVAGHNGLNVYLTIDEVIQSIMEEELDKLMENARPDAAYAVMVDPKTGDVLAMAQRPTFDPNDRKLMNSLSWRLRLLEDVYEPGSIMKPLTVSGALDLGVVRPNTIIDCEQKVWYFMNRPLTDTHAYGQQTVTGVIRKSSNIGTAKIAVMMGKERINMVLRRFGLGERTGIPLTPESRGIFPAPKYWDGLSISRFPIGYGIAVTPLQMARAYAALADNGNRRELRLIHKVEDPDTGEIQEMPYNAPLPLFRRPETSKEILEMMLSVTEEGGTAKQAKIPGYNVAGKTGTARKAVGRHYVSGKYYASFIGIVPMEEPAFVLLLTVDSPKSSIYGGTVAGPVFRAIAERTLKYMDIKPNPELLEELEKQDTKRR